MVSVMPASSCNHARMVFMLCPSARAALISGHNARIWPAFVAGFSARRDAKRLRVATIQFGGISVWPTDRKRASKYKGIARGHSGHSHANFVGESAPDPYRRVSLRRVVTFCDNVRQNVAHETTCGRLRRIATTYAASIVPAAQRSRVVEHKENV